MGRKRLPGLRKRGAIWHIEKSIKGYGALRGTPGQDGFYESTGESELDAAEQVATQRLAEIREQIRRGERPSMNFRQAAAKYLDEATHKSAARDAASLALIEPFIGDVALHQLHADTPALQAFVEARQSAGIRSSTVRRDLAVVRRVLTLAACKWRHDVSSGGNVPWLESVPLLDMPDWQDRKVSYPLSWQEQARFLDLLPEHLQRMTLFAVNTGLREENVCGLRWAWEVPVTELDTSVFVIPGEFMKNKQAFVLVLNSIAQAVIEDVRDQHDEYVFVYKGHRLVEGMHNSAWQRAWRQAGLPTSKDVRKGPHNLRHTFGRRLRAAGVAKETRSTLLGHSTGDITTHYSAAELQELIDAVETIAVDQQGQQPVITLLRTPLA